MDSLALVVNGRMMPLSSARRVGNYQRDLNSAYFSGTAPPGWSAGKAFRLSLVRILPAAPQLAPQGIYRAGTGTLSLTWLAPSGALTGYDVHYTEATSGAADNAAPGTDPATGWVAVAREGTATHQYISGLVDDREYRVRVRARNANGGGAWVIGTGEAGPEQVQPFRLTPDPSALTGLTINDGTRNLKLEPAIKGAVGLGSWHFRYAVHVAPGITRIRVTPTWTASGTSLAGRTVDATHGTGQLSTTSWSSAQSGASRWFNLAPRGGGATLLELNLTNTTHSPNVIYRIHVFHNASWKSANDRLGQLELQIPQ